MLFLSNAFSVHMLEHMNVGDFRNLDIERISARETGRMLRENAFRSFFGHSETAERLSRYLRVEIPVSRGALVFRPHDVLILATLESKRNWELGYSVGDPGWKFYLVTYRSH